VAGRSSSLNFPGTTGGAQPTFAGGFGDAFVARLNSALTALPQATYLGGNALDVAYALAIHPTSGEIYAAGRTDSTNFPGTAGGAQLAIGGGTDAFVARINSALTALPQATYLGGIALDVATALAIHPTSGEIYVAGETFSTNFPGTAGGAQPSNAGLDAFVARLNSALTALPQATYLGGSLGDRPMFGAFSLPLAIHPTSGEIYVAGETNSTNFPGTTGGAQPTNAGGSFDAFVARLTADLAGLQPTPTPTATPPGPTPTPTPTSTLTPTPLGTPGPGAPSDIPTLSPGLLVLLALGLAATGFFLVRKV
jgi:muconolactone delta-isomerase